MSRGNEFTKQFRTLFENEKSKLLAARAPFVGHFTAVSEDLSDDMDLAARDLDSQMNLRMLKRETQYLEKIEQALARLNEGTFGACESCEEEIELKRLEARPTTTSCFACKEAAERRERGHAAGMKHQSAIQHGRMRLA